MSLWPPQTQLGFDSALAACDNPLPGSTMVVRRVHVVEAVQLSVWWCVRKLLDNVL